MIYEERQYDLFDVNDYLVQPGDEPYQLAHCISADFGMYAGIVTGFNNRWNMKRKLVSKQGNALDSFQTIGGHAIPVEVQTITHMPFTVYNLITKLTVYDKPSYKAIEQALKDMKSKMSKEGQERLAIPLLGCGIDGKDWNKVSEVIQSVFEDTNVEILVCRR